jgi:hypothetical protein
MAGFLSYFRPDRSRSVGGDADAGVVGFERRANLTEQAAIPKEGHPRVHVMNQVMVLAEQHDVTANPSPNTRIAVASCLIEWRVGEPHKPHLQNQLCELGGEPPQQQEVESLSKEERNDQQQQTDLQMTIQTGSIRFEVSDTSTDLCRQHLEQRIGQEWNACDGFNDCGD